METTDAGTMKTTRRKQKTETTTTERRTTEATTAVRTDLRERNREENAFPFHRVHAHSAQKLLGDEHVDVDDQYDLIGRCLHTKVSRKPCFKVITLSSR